MISLKDLLADEQVYDQEISGDSTTVIPYPQANSLDVVLQVIDTLRESGNSIYDLVSTRIVKSARQASYYYNAAAFLGFCFKRGNYFYPTELVSELRAAGEVNKASKFAAMVLANQHVSRLFIGVSRFPNNETKLTWLANQIGSCVRSSVTRRRRASSMLSWLAWVQKNLPRIAN